jgi:aryl-alcohol dehydrogenase-like predicted oxidoreductase
MRYRALGQHAGLRVSEVGLGTGKFGGIIPSETAAQIMGVYAEAGGRYIDTAAGYQGGRSEETVGGFLQGRRDEFVVGTKWAVGMMRDEPFTVRGTNRKAMVLSVEQSLKRLGTEYIDILWTHGYDDKVPVEEIMLGFDRLVTQGKIRYGGLGTHPAWKTARAATIAELRGWAPLAGVTIEYGASERDAERELLPAAEALGLGVVAWSPLGGGFLGRPAATDAPPASHLPHWFRQGRPTPKDIDVHTAVAEVAGEMGESAGTVGYAWLLQRARQVQTSLIPVMAASSPDMLRDDLRALDLELSGEQFARIEAAGAPILGEPHVHNIDSDPLQEGGDFYRPAHPIA